MISFEFFFLTNIICVYMGMMFQKILLERDLAKAKEENEVQKQILDGKG